ncbi:ABC transporter ATP-binding protein, partial [Patescibacteria group bacterium]|nr:ABC transporter ATP-binding protein [Patescibacteria group bacterium]MBU1891073.1 ABC transporter ATP-binding protein [Patescibacteria group bacterium]
MKFIWVYLRRYKKVLYGALVLALINQTFSLADPQIFRLIVDNYASKVGDIAQNDFVRGIIILLLTSIGVAFISRVAKSFQDYYVNVITQKLGTQMYSDSVRHSFSLPFSVFEDQRSGELLEKLQKARNDTQDLVEKLVNVLFLSIIGVLFVVIYAFVVHWMIGMVYFLIIPTLGIITYYISRGIKEAQKNVVKETTSLAGSTTETLRNVELVKSLGLDEQEVSRLNKVNEKILQLELKK